MVSKIRSKCKKEKDESGFYKNKRTPDGLDYYCKECRKEMRNSDCEEGYIYANREFVESLKTECCKCGEDRPWVIEFHHVDPDYKNFNLSQFGTRSKAAIWDEASKCVCLCANCHAEFHHIFGKVPFSPVDSLDKYLNDDRY